MTKTMSFRELLKSLKRLLNKDAKRKKGGFEKDEDDDLDFGKNFE